MRKQGGFTLLELMIVVAVIGILAMIAYPSYSDYVRRGKIAEATSTLMNVRSGMERFFLDNRTYAGSDAAANLPCDVATMGAGKKYFTFACSNLGTSTYTVTASGVAAQGMTNFVYTIDQQNTRTTTITGTPGWNATVNCWVTKKGGIC
jgi:prepilin-type N-terminal cleavage/methylation domain-containing protein